MPEVPAVPGRPGLAAAVQAVFAPGGALSIALDGFEARPAQLEMAAAVADVFDDGGILLAEAGTGTGKTLAYLVPAILSRERVLDAPEDDRVAATVKAEVERLARKFPLYPELQQ